MADLFSALPYVVDLDKPVTKTMLYNLFVTTNKKAHRFIITLRRGGVDVPFTGSVVGTLINYSDMMTQEYPGRAEDGKVVFDWPASFYAKSGLFCVIITVDDGEVSNSVFAAEGSMILGETDTLYDPSHVVPSLSELLAQIDATRNAATAANNAANSANSAATDATSAANRANAAAQSIEGLTVSASPGAAADAEITEQDGAKHIHFTLQTGATPDITFEVATGAPGTQVQVQQSGTPEAPIVLLTIPRGDTGSVDGINYFEGNPSALGTANPGTANGVARGDHVHPLPTAEDVGALPEDGTAVNADAFGGKTLEQVKAEIRLEEHAIGSFYISSNSTSPAELFGGTWEQIKDRVLMAAGDTITAGSTGGAFTHEHGLSTAYAKIRYIDAGRLASADVPGEWTGDRRTAAVLEPAAYEYTYSVGTGIGGNTDAADHTSPYLGVYVWHRIA